MGIIAIADEVVAEVAAIAVKEVEGVSSVATGQKGVKVSTEGNEATITMNISVEYGVNIPKTSVLVQDKVKSAVESMTGLNVKLVNVKILSINA